MEIESLQTEEKNEEQRKNIKERIQNSNSQVFILSAKGTSMWPTLLDGDILYFKKKKDEDELKAGDVVSYLDDNGRMICHRVVKNENEYLRTVGDSNYILNEVETSDCNKIKTESVLGILAFVKRKDKTIDSFPNKNKNSAKAIKIKYKFYNCIIKNNYRKEKFLKFNIILRLMLIRNRRICKENIEKINLDQYQFSTLKINENNFKLEIYSGETIINTIYYKKTDNMVYIYKISIRMRNFGNGMEFIAIKYLKNSGLNVYFDKTSKNYINRYFEDGIKYIK